MSDAERLLYGRGKLLLSVVARDTGERFVALTKAAGARGGTILPARGTAESGILELLGMGDTEKDVVITLLSDGEFGAVMDAVRAYAGRARRRSGIVMVIDVPRVLKHLGTGPLPERRTEMDSHDHTLITFIVNRGFSDDAMAAARKAGATGGTVLGARGTGKEEDVKFFGINLVPEKDVLLIVVSSDKADAVLEAVRSVPCLAERGSGIAFSVEVDDFIRLGKE